MMIERCVGPWTLRGASIGGFGTTIAIRELGVTLDAGFFLPELLRGDHLFLSHGHPDHVGALVSWLGARRLLGMNTANIFAPVGMAGGLVEALSAWRSFSGVEFDHRVFGIAAGADLELRGDLRVRAFPAQHRVETLGWLFERETSRLRREHQGLEGEEIARLRRTLPHDEVFERVRTPLVAYVPDTLPEALDAMPEGCWAAQVLLVECTFLDDRKPLEKIRQGAHVHLDDLVARLDRFHGGAIVPFHFSRSYEAGEIPALLEARVPAPWRERVVPFI